MLVPDAATSPVSQLTSSEWRAFKDTAPWQEYTQALEVQLKGVQQAYDSADNVEVLRLLQGQAKILRAMLEYPDEIAEMIDGMKEFNEETDNGNGI